MIRDLIIIAGLVHVGEGLDGFIGKVSLSVFGGVDASSLYAAVDTHCPHGHSFNILPKHILGDDCNVCCNSFCAFNSNSSALFRRAISTLNMSTLRSVFVILFIHFELVKSHRM